MANIDSVDTGTTLTTLKMREICRKYWENAENINMLMYVANVLDPRCKLEFTEYYFKNLYKQENIDAGDCLWKQMVQRVRATTFDLFNEYQRNIEDQQQNEDFQSDDSIKHMTGFVREFYEWSKKRKLDGEDDVDNTTEFDRYINEGCEKSKLGDSYDILLWWKTNSARFPILSKIAKDVLAIPMSAIAPESAFSTNCNLLDDFRSSLSPEMVESLICTQDWLRESKKQIEVEEALLNLDKFLEDDFDEQEEDSTSSGSE